MLHRYSYPGKRLILLIVALLLATMSCGTDEPPTSHGSANDDAGGSDIAGSKSGTEEINGDAEPEPDFNEPLRVAFHWVYAFQDWSGFIVAERDGFYEEEGLTVEFNFLQGSALAVQTAAAGEVDIGVADSASLLAGLSEGAPLTAIANHIQKTPIGLMAKAETGLRSLEDLEGLTVSSSRVGPEEALLAAFLRANNMEPGTDVELISVEPQAKCTIMLAGRTDVCTGFRTQHVINAKLEGEDIDFISFYSENTPLIGSVVFAQNDVLSERPDAIQAFLRATLRGYREAENDPEKTLRYFVEAVDDAESEEYLRLGLEESHSLMRSGRTEEHGWGWMDEDTWSLFHDTLLKGDVIDHALNIEEIYTTEFLPEDASW